MEPGRVAQTAGLRVVDETPQRQLVTEIKEPATAAGPDRGFLKLPAVPERPVEGCQDSMLQPILPGSPDEDCKRQTEGNAEPHGPAAFIASVLGGRRAAHRSADFDGSEVPDSGPAATTQRTLADAMFIA